MSGQPARADNRGGRTRRGRKRRSTRAIPVLGLAITAFLIGAIVGSGHSSNAKTALASQFTSAWSSKNYAAMYKTLDRHARRTTSPRALAALYGHAARTATATRLLVTGRPSETQNGTVAVPVVVYTRLFGRLRERFTLPFDGSGKQARIAWSPYLEFPGLRPKELLSRATALPRRAALLARNGSVLASGPATGAGERASPLDEAASAIVGSLGPIPDEKRSALAAEGVPANAIVGVSGLERIFDARLRGTPGGKLLAGKRVLARTKARPAAPVRTTISPTVQIAAVQALGDHYGGVVVMQPATGEILGVAGIGLDAVQPPGSTFKIVTVTGVLANHVASPTSTFPYATYALLDGVKLGNSESESCGGSLTLAFAVSCNSVFAPLGVKLGATRLVQTAERYGFNHEPSIAGAMTSTIPHASSIEGELALGSTAIGQGEVLASPLEMVTIASTIADRGLRPQPTFALPASARSSTARGGAAGDSGSSASRAARGRSGRDTASHAGGGENGAVDNAPPHLAKRVRVSSPAIADSIRTMMVDVVKEGTGTAAAIPNVLVAGKTGTAELGPPPGAEACSSAGEAPEEQPAEGEASAGEGAAEGCSSADSAAETDAWFTAFAPASGKPKVAVAVMLVRDGFGGDTAAPIARQILEAGLR